MRKLGDKLFNSVDEDGDDSITVSVWIDGTRFQIKKAIWVGLHKDTLIVNTTHNEQHLLPIKGTHFKLLF